MFRFLEAIFRQNTKERLLITHPQSLVYYQPQDGFQEPNHFLVQS
jgi:hypothetical protein